MRDEFDVLLSDLKNKIVCMSNLVHNSIDQSIQSLKNRDLALAEQVVNNDRLINNHEREIEQLCTHLIATRQPFASDLRKIVASYKIISALERMGDLAKDIAKISLRIGPVPLIKPLIDLPTMADEVINMMHSAVEAFINGDLEQARSLAEADHKVDRYYKIIFDELNNMMKEDSNLATQVIYLLLITRYIERIGDYCTNIGEEIIYMELGVREDLNR